MLLKRLETGVLCEVTRSLSKTSSSLSWRQESCGTRVLVLTSVEHHKNLTCIQLAYWGAVGAAHLIYDWQRVRVRQALGVELVSGAKFRKTGKNHSGTETERVRREKFRLPAGCETERLRRTT